MSGTSINDFAKLFRAVGKMPITIRVLLEDENGNKNANFLDYKPLLDNICEAAYETMPELTLMFPAEILSYNEANVPTPTIVDKLCAYRNANYKFDLGAIIEEPSEKAYQYLDLEAIRSLSFGTNDISAKVHDYK